LNHFNAGATKYFLFTHLNLEDYFIGTPAFEDMTLLFSISILLANVLFFYLMLFELALLLPKIILTKTGHITEPGPGHFHAFIVYNSSKWQH